MIDELHIQNLALIKDVRLRPLVALPSLPEKQEQVKRHFCPQLSS